MADLSSLADKLRRVREHERSEANWNGISYALQPPISAAEIESVELAHRIRLPEDYRAFLLEIGNGGVGPGYGLLPLESALAERGQGIYGLAEPFVPPRSCADWVQLRAPGMLPIHHDGCAYFTGLVISGPERGTVWSYVDIEPGWIPKAGGPLVDEDGKPFEFAGDDYPRWYDVHLLPRNRDVRVSFREHMEAWADAIIGAATRS
jgi:hypothetical protein